MLQNVRPWKINLILLFSIFLIIIIVPASILNIVLTLIVFGSSIWAYIDSKNINVQNYKKTFLMPSSSPIGVAIVILLLWGIAFPLYIVWRYKALNGMIPLR